MLVLIGCQNDENPTNNQTTTDMGPNCGAQKVECDACQREESVCEDGDWICKTDLTLELPDSCKTPCEDDLQLESIGESCGCSGKFECVDDAVSCVDALEKNACGGCLVLEESVGETCGECGENICEGIDAISCLDPGLNTCGGCKPIVESLGDSCGETPQNLWICDDLDSLKCTKEEGETCVLPSDCFSENCSFGICSPVGYSHVQAATFTMGAPIGERGRHSGRENGQHEVELTRALFVKQTTVTQREYLAMTGGNPSYFENCGLDCPVERVNFYEMLEYANRLSLSQGLDACYTLTNCTDDKYNQGCLPTVRNGLLCSSNTFVCDDDTIDAALDCNGYRLPTESEWEYFARAGTTSAFITPSGLISNYNFTPLSPELDAIAWYFGNSKVSYEGGLNCLIPDARISCDDLPEIEFIGPHPVALKNPNMWGLYDITGNVWERVWDISGDYPLPGSSVVDPTGPSIAEAVNSFARRMRGGNFLVYGQYLRVAYRTGPGARTRIYNTGFRLVRSVQKK